jgi:hypothetical protein
MGISVINLEGAKTSARKRKKRRKNKVAHRAYGEVLWGAWMECRDPASIAEDRYSELFCYRY